MCARFTPAVALFSLAVSLLALSAVCAQPVVVHDWTISGPGGRYGVREYLRPSTIPSQVTAIWIGPLGARRVYLSPRTAVLGYAGSIALGIFALGYGFAVAKQKFEQP